MAILREEVKFLSLEELNSIKTCMHMWWFVYNTCLKLLWQSQLVTCSNAASFWEPFQHVPHPQSLCDSVCLLSACMCVYDVRFKFCYNKLVTVSHCLFSQVQDCSNGLQGYQAIPPTDPCPEACGLDRSHLADRGCSTSQAICFPAAMAWAVHAWCLPLSPRAHAGYFVA